ncbi:MAG: divergent polysaccharide deacetylase family protein [Thermodesulfobacteriota bacterium]
MVTAKKKRKKKRPKQRKKGRQWLVFCVVAVLFASLGGLVVFLALSPDDATVLPKIGEVDGNGPTISYEETYVVPEPVIVAQPVKKSQVVPVSPDVTPEDGGLVAKRERPLVAIVIDDMGYNKKNCEALLDLDLDLSFAFLPFGPYTEHQASRAHRLGRDVLLHFPMEASDPKWKPGRGTIAIAMDSPEIRRIFVENLAAVPYASGINNHMGSRFTQNNQSMQDFMEAMQESGLFFLDSRTSRNSVGYSLAKKMAVRTAERDIFLDNVRDPQKIIIQLRKLVDVARRQGFAIAIGHPYPETLQALKEYKREILQQVKVVGVGTLVR